MNKYLPVVLCSLTSIGPFAYNSTIQVQECSMKYTLCNFFDTIDLTTILGTSEKSQGLLLVSTLRFLASVGGIFHKFTISEAVHT